MTRRLVYTDAAEADLIHAATYIAEASGSSEIAESFIVGLDEKCRHLAALPGTLGTGRPELRHDIRSTPHGEFVIFFRYRDDAVEIVDILHGSRDIAAWFEGER